MEDLVGGAKAGGGLGNLVDGFLERDRLAEQMAHGMVGPGVAGPNAAMAGATMMGEDAAQLGMFAAPPVTPGLDVEDFLAASQGYAAEDAAFAQMDAAMAQAQHAMAGPSVDDFAAFQAAQGPSGEESIVFQAAQGPSAADFAAFQAAQGASVADFAAFQQMQGPSAADFAALQQAQGPSAADFAAFQATQGPSATVEAFQAAQGPSVADFQAFQQSQQGPSVADFKAFQRQAGATGRRAEVAAAHEKCLLRADAVPSWSQPGKHWLAKTLAKGDAGAAEIARVFAHDMGGSIGCWKAWKSGWSESSEEFKQAVLEALLSTDEFETRLLAGAAAAGIGPSASEEAESFSAAHVAQAHEMCLLCADAVQDLSRPQRHWLASNLAKWDDAGAAEITKVYGHDIGGNLGWSDRSEEFKQAVQEALLSTDEFRERLLAGAAAAGFGPLRLAAASDTRSGVAASTGAAGFDASTTSASEEAGSFSAAEVAAAHEKCLLRADAVPSWSQSGKAWLAKTLAKGDAGMDTKRAYVFAHDMGRKLGWFERSEEFKQAVLEALLSTDEFETRLLAGAAAAGIGPSASEEARSRFKAELEEYDGVTSLKHDERTVGSARQKCLLVADLISTQWPVGARGYLARTLEKGAAGVEDMTKVFVYDLGNNLGWRDSSDEFQQALLKVLMSTDEFKTRLLAGAAAAGIGPLASEEARSRFQAELEEYEDETLRLGGKPGHLSPEQGGTYISPSALFQRRAIESGDSIQAKADLTKQVKSFVTEVQAFREDWVEHGLAVPGIAATEALMRLEKFDSAFAEIRRKADTYSSDEARLGMPRTEYTELDLTEKELHVAKRLLRGLGHTL